MPGQAGWFLKKKKKIWRVLFEAQAGWPVSKKKKRIKSFVWNITVEIWKIMEMLLLEQIIKKG